MKVQQLNLFGWADGDKPLPPDKTEHSESLPRSNPADWHRIHELKPDGTFEWVASYSSKFSALYAMQLFWCELMKRDHFCLDDLLKAKEAIVVGKTGRSVILELEGHTYTCHAKRGKSVIEGINGSKYDYKRFKVK